MYVVLCSDSWSFSVGFAEAGRLSFDSNREVGHSVSMSALSVAYMVVVWVAWCIRGRERLLLLGIYGFFCGKCEVSINVSEDHGYIKMVSGHKAGQ